MKKSLFLIAIVLGMTTQVMAQLAIWTLQPAYDSIELKEDGKIILTDSAGWTIMWSPEGRRLFATQETLMPFNEGLATVIKNSNKTILGFVDMNGKFTKLPNLEVAYNDPNFHSDFLTVKEVTKDGEDYVYYTIGADKEGSFSPVVQRYPFSHGFAPYFTYDNLEKKKDPYYGYYRSDKRTIEYQISNYKNEKNKLDPKDISFVSGIGSNNKGIAVIKSKLYWFDPNTCCFEPMLAGDSTLQDKKRHVQVLQDYENYHTSLISENPTITGTFGNKQYAFLNFDKTLHPTNLVFDSDTLDLREKEPIRAKALSNLASTKIEGQHSLKFKNQIVLPAQFDEIGTLYGNRALVKKNDKWGIIEVFPNDNYTLSLSRKDAIGFRHQKYETKITVDLPKNVSASKVFLDASEVTGVDLNKRTRQSEDKEEGNYVDYECTLYMPDSLSDVETNIIYKNFKIENDGIKYFPQDLKARAWHLKCYSVEPEIESNEKDQVTFYLNIGYDRKLGEEDYPFDVIIDADSIDCQKISEKRYKCTVSGLNEGENKLDITVKENGCPPCIFPFSITYTKAVPKKKEKDKVEIVKKKTPEVSGPILPV